VSRSHDHLRMPPRAPPADRAPPGRRRGWLLIAAGLVLACAATGVYTVEPNEQAVVRRCGRMLPDLRGPGLHVGLPYGLDEVTRVRTAELKRVTAGAGALDRSLGRAAAPQQAENLTGDRNLLVVSAVVQYRVADARAYLFQAADVPALVEDLAASALASILTAMKVDDILTVERVAIQNAVQQAAQAALDRHGAGVQVTAVTLQIAAPPPEVAEAFRDVTIAREDRQRAVNEAQGYANRLLPQARGEAQRILLEAQGYAEETATKARGDADRFRQVAARLTADRQVTARRLVLEMAEEVLPRLVKIILDPPARPGLDLGIIEGKQ